MMWTIVLFGCTPTEVPSEPVEAVAPAPGELLIEEVYYSGATPTGGTERYFSDQFVELVNATTVPLDIGGVKIGDAYGVAGAINPGTQPDSYRDQRPNGVVLDSVWRIPQGTRLEPGASIVVAHDGTNHNPFSTVDLSGAAFEAFVIQSGGDDDYPTVDNLDPIVFNGGFDWLVPVFGASIVVLDSEIQMGRIDGPFGRLATAPSTSVLDGVDALMDGNSSDFKRLPDAVDSGFAWVSGTYTGESIQRRRTDDGWQDTNDSSADFMVGPPDPAQPTVTDEIFGDAWIELGVGFLEFSALEDGASVELVEGPQGGYHVDVALRFGGFGPDGIELSYSAVDAEGESISFITGATLSESGVREDGTDAWIRVGDRVVLDIPSTTAVVGDEVVIRVTAELAGQTWSDEHRVVVVNQE